jgi:ATP-binding cassette subfamily B protein
METYLPTALAKLLAAVREHRTDHDILGLLMVFLGVQFVQISLARIGWKIYNLFEVLVFTQLMDDAFAHIQRMSERFLINNFAGSLISRMTRGRSRIEDFEDKVLLDIMPIFIIVVGSLGFLAVQFAALAIVLALYILILVAVSIHLVIRIGGPAQAIAAQTQDSTNAQLADCITGLSTTKVFAQEEREIASYARSTQKLRQDTTKAYLLGNMIWAVQRYMQFGMLSIMLGGGIWYVLRGWANVESLAYLTFAYSILQGYVRNFGDVIRRLLTAAYDLHGVINLMREPEDVADPVGAVPLTVTEGAIAFDNVTFTYPGKTTPVFEGLSLTIRAGERIAVVGHSGGGKTSFVRLLQRLYDVQSGRILIDGQDIAHGTQRSLRQAIALVPQDPILFHRSLRDNIAYGKPDASLADVRRAAEQAHIDGFIMSLPEQYGTLVGERGIKLSGGERQRVAMARAILADRPILILDEATSSLDSASERAIQDALKSLTHGRTSIMIAHRLSTILDADRIVVFEKGRIVEEGTHEELAARADGIYAGFFRMQSGGYIGED